MITEPAIIALKSAVGLLATWLFVFLLWKDYCLDRFRESVFSLRDELFSYAADGNISFDHPAYTMLRGTMNVSLRYAHEFTLARLFLAIAVESNTRNSEIVAWEAALKSLPPDTQTALTTTRSRFAIAVLEYMTLRSFLLYLLVLLARLVDRFRTLAKRYILPQIVIGIERLESEALEEDARQNAKKHPIAAHAT